MKKLFFILMSFCLISCASDKRRGIANINLDGVDSSFFRDLEEKYFIDSTLIDVYQPSDGMRVDDYMRKYRYAKYFVHFKSEPQEIVGFDGFVLREIYSPKISRNTINNHSSEIGEYNKRRIATRLQLLIMKYQNERQSFESLDLMMSKDWIDKDSGGYGIKGENMPM